MTTHGFDSVFFDCDSTLSKIEGIDELASFKNVREEVSRITNSAMDGCIDFQTALDQRLSIIRPSRKELFQIGQKYIDEAVDGATELIDILLKSGKNIYILSGGFMDSVRIFAEFLGVDVKNVFANEIYFDTDGNYNGFNRGLSLSRSNGKRDHIKAFPGRKVMIGDGAGDLETKDTVDLFIGYCGVKKRQIIEEKADIVVYDQNLMSLAPFIIGSSSDYEATKQVKFNNIDLANIDKVIQ